MYELVYPCESTLKKIVDLLVAEGVLRKVGAVDVAAYQLGRTLPVLVEATSIPPAFVHSQYIGNGRSIETNFESIAKNHLGVCEDKKEFSKRLNSAAKEYGHDDLIESFFEWTRNISSTYMGKRPVDMFLKNISQNMVVRKPLVSNPLLDKMQQGVSLLTDNKVFFSGIYRTKLALLIKNHGLTEVSQVFAEFWNLRENDDKITWMPRDFLERAEVMINTNKIKQLQAKQQQTNVANAYEEAKQNVEVLEEEEEL